MSALSKVIFGFNAAFNGMAQNMIIICRLVELESGLGLESGL